jgi:hypothetical protein
VDVAGGPRPIGPSRPMPDGVAQCHPGPCHITDPWDGLHTASLVLIHVGLIQVRLDEKLEARYDNEPSRARILAR